MSYKKELDFAVSVAQEAGKIMRRYFRAEDINAEWKEDNTPLTIADTTVNDTVIEKVKQAFPEHSVLGEENSYDNGGEYVWVVDPIDGTVPFVLGMPFSTFSMGLVAKKDGQPLAGVVYDPHLKHLYTATKGGGAFLNGRRLQVSSAIGFSRTYISVIGGNEPEDKKYFKQGRCSDLILAQGAKTLALQSQAYCGTRVATGELIGSIFGYGAPWDVAATSLMVQEAGGVVTDLYGKPRRYDEFADGCVHAPNQTILTKLLNAVEEAAL